MEFVGEGENADTDDAVRQVLDIVSRAINF